MAGEEGRHMAGITVEASIQIRGNVSLQFPSEKEAEKWIAAVTPDFDPESANEGPVILGLAMVNLKGQLVKMSQAEIVVSPSLEEGIHG